MLSSSGSGGLVLVKHASDAGPVAKWPRNARDLVRGEEDALKARGDEPLCLARNKGSSMDRRADGRGRRRAPTRPPVRSTAHPHARVCVLVSMQRSPTCRGAHKCTHVHTYTHTHKQTCMPAHTRRMYRLTDVQTYRLAGGIPEDNQ